MPDKSRLPVEEKIKIVEEYLDGKASASTIRDTYGIVHQTLHEWVRLYKLRGISGLSTITSNRKYKTEYNTESATDTVTITVADTTPPPTGNYTVTVNGSYATTSGAGDYAENATVTIRAGSRADYSFDGWTTADNITFSSAGSPNTIFTMPAHDVTVTASWRHTNTHGGNGGSGGNTTYTPPTHTYGYIMVYGVRVDYSIELSTGILTLNLTRSQLDSIIKTAGSDITHIALNLTGISGVKGLDVNFPPAWFVEHPGVTFAVQSGMGEGRCKSGSASEHHHRQAGQPL